MESVYAKCTNERKKACRNNTQLVRGGTVDGSTGKILGVRCEFCKHETLRILSSRELAGNRDAQARLKERGKP